jgi:nucleoid-associated protein YgaU
LAEAQRQIADLQRVQSEAVRASVDERAGADRARAELEQLRGRLGEVEKVAETHNASVAELTELNEKLAGERDGLLQQLATARAESARLAQAQQAAEQQRSEGERTAAQSLEAVSAQLAQMRREVDGLRGANQTLSEANRALERDRQTVLSQLRQENTALAARLAQAQGTLDQIAAAARLGTPAANIASANVPSAAMGGGATSAPAPASPEPRFHVVAEGDSLSRLSLRYFGTTSRWQDIFNANRDVLQGANSLRVGQRLRIP